jgi:hypothetical protein
MRQTLDKISWLILCLTPILFWWEIYRASTTEYDENWAHFFLAVFVSFLTVGILVFNRKSLQFKNKFILVIKLTSLLLASPITVGLIILYQMTIPMQWKWSSSHVKDGKSYSDIKKRNYFKAENYLILDDLTTEADTILVVVTRSGEIEKIERFEGGQRIELNNSILDDLTEKQRDKLTEY